MKKIIVIGSFAESLLNFRGHLLTRLVEKGYDVVACAPDASDDLIEALARMHVSYVRVPVDRTGKNPLNDIVLFCSICVLLFKSRPDYLLAYTIKPVIFVSLASVVFPFITCSSIITGLGYAFSQGEKKVSSLQKLIFFLYKLALKHNKTVIFQNPDDRRLFEKLGLVSDTNNKIRVVNGSGVDLDYYHFIPPQPKPSFLMIARLIRDKGVYEYIEAAEQIRKKYPDIEVSLAGWIDSNPAAIEEEDLVLWINKKIIRYLGRLDDVRPALEKCSVYVLPSYREGTPRTVLEAMSIGRAIITTDVPGCRETVEPGINGFLVDKLDVQGLILAMEKFIVEPDLALRMGMQSRRIATEKYDVKTVSESIIHAMEI